MTSITTKSPLRRGRSTPEPEPPQADPSVEVNADTTPDATDALLDDVADDTADDSTDGPSEPVGPSAARTWRPTPRFLWTFTVVLLIGALAVAATLGRAAWQERQVDQSRAEALASGKQLAVNFIAMNFSTFDADTKRVLDGATGEFRKEYSATLDKLKPVVVGNKTVSTVERAEAALVAGDTDSAQVLVGVIAPTTNTASPTPQKKTYRLRLDLVKDGAAWKVTSLDFVS